METIACKALHTTSNQNGNNASPLNVMGMPTNVKITHAQTYGQLSCVEASLAPRQMGPPPHVRYELAEIMRVIEGAVTVLEGDKVVQAASGGYHYRPRSLVNIFWNGHDAPAKIIEMHQGTQDFANHLKEPSLLGIDPHNEGSNTYFF